MERVKESAGPTGLQIPQEILERCGLGEGTSVIIEPHRSWIKIAPEIMPVEVSGEEVAQACKTKGHLR